MLDRFRRQLHNPAGQRVGEQVGDLCEIAERDGLCLLLQNACCNGFVHLPHLVGQGFEGVLFGAGFVRTLLARHEIFLAAGRRGGQVAQNVAVLLLDLLCRDHDGRRRRQIDGGN